MNQIINMIIRQITRRLINQGINMGIKGASSLGRKSRAPQPDSDPQKERIRREQEAVDARQAKQSAKIMRRTTKF